MAKTTKPAKTRLTVEGEIVKYTGSSSAKTWRLIARAPNGDCDFRVEHLGFSFHSESAARADARRVAKTLGLRIKRWD